MSNDPLRTMRDDLHRPDSAILAEVAEALLAGSSVEAATVPARASLALAALREFRTIVAGMVAGGVGSAVIRRELLGVFDDPARCPADPAFLRPIVERALDAELGPAGREGDA